MIFGIQLGYMACAVAFFVLGRILMAFMRKSVRGMVAGILAMMLLVFLVSFIHVMYGLSEFNASALGGVACAVWNELNIGRFTAKGSAQ